MTERSDNIAEKAKRDQTRPLVSAVLDDGTIVETLFRAKENETLFCIGKDGEWREAPEILIKGRRYVPYSPENNLLKHRAVLLPEKPEEYGTQADLVTDIQAFIHRYAQVSSAFEQLAAYYVLFSWVHDAFNELPYLRVQAGYGCGKTRFLLTVGSLCYKPIFASGASTVSPLFRILDAFQGTLIIDESDFRVSDEKAEVVKILNNGSVRGFPVLRSEITPNKEINPRAFHVFGPKIMASRGPFEDPALESRFLTETLGREPLRPDIPINLPNVHGEEALHLRNRLLAYRLDRLHTVRLLDSDNGPSAMPRFDQITRPLFSIVEDAQAREELRQFGVHAAETAREDSTEERLLGIIREMMAEGDTRLSVGEITARFAERHAGQYHRPVTPKWIGWELRTRLGLDTRKSEGVFVVSPEEAPGMFGQED